MQNWFNFEGKKSKMKNTPILLLCIFFSCWVLPTLYAQTEGISIPDTSRIEKVNVFGGVSPSKPVDMVVDDTQSSSVAYNTPLHEPLPAPDWTLKCNPVILARGEVPVYLEHKLNTSWSTEAAIGITFRDMIKDDVLQEKPLFQKDPNADVLSGLCGKIALRYFPGHHACSDFYFSPELDYTSYRKDITGVYMGSDGQYVKGKLRDEQQYADFRFQVGWQNSDALDSDFSFDWFLGAGIRLGSENNVEPDERNANVIVLNHANVVTPVIALGVKIGLGLKE